MTNQTAVDKPPPKQFLLLFLLLLLRFSFLSLYFFLFVALTNRQKATHTQETIRSAESINAYDCFIWQLTLYYTRKNEREKNLGYFVSFRGKKDSKMMYWEDEEEGKKKRERERTESQSALSLFVIKDRLLPWTTFPSSLFSTFLRVKNWLTRNEKSDFAHLQGQTELLLPNLSSDVSQSLHLHQLKPTHQQQRPTVCFFLPISIRWLFIWYIYIWRLK